MNRRTFLRISGLALAGIIGYWYGSRQNGPTQAEQLAQLDLSCKPGSGTVLVIGSGLAGLAAARTLHDLGYTVTVLEARDRNGGRVFTRDDLGFPLDVGASWIHGVDGNPITSLVEANGLSLTIPTSNTSARVYDNDGTRFSTAQLGRTLFRFGRDMGAFAEAAGALTTDQSIYDTLVEQDQLGNSSGADRRLLNYMYYGNFHQAYAISPQNMGSQGYYLSNEGWEGEEHWIEGGLGQIVDVLAAGLTIEHNQIVNAIDYTQNGAVTVQTDQATFTADRCIVTVPLGVLKKEAITFTPPLPNAIQHSIDNLAFGRFFKLAMTFPSIFWDESVHTIGSVGANIGDYGAGDNVVFFNLKPLLDQPGLVMFAGAEFAEALEQLTPEEALAIGMSRLRQIYGDNIPEPDQFIVSDWFNSPFTGGSYSGLGLNTTPADMDAFTALLAGQLTFAGEHTSANHSSTIHGAYISGLKAAKRICDSF